MRAAIHQPKRDIPAKWIPRHQGRNEAPANAMSKMRNQRSVPRIGKKELISPNTITVPRPDNAIPVRLVNELWKL